GVVPARVAAPLGEHVLDARVQVALAHGVARRLERVGDRSVAMEVVRTGPGRTERAGRATRPPRAGPAEVPAAATVPEPPPGTPRRHQVTGQVEVRAFTGVPEQLDERRLDLGVPVEVGYAALRPAAHEEVRRRAGDAEQVVAARRAVERDPGLDEVPEAVQLV